MAPTWRRSSFTDDSARDAARQAAIRRRDIYMAIRSHLATLYPTYPSLVVRSQQSAGAEGQYYYVALVLYESSQSSRRLSASNPVISRDEQYYDDRLVAGADLARYTVLLNGTPGIDQTEGMARLLERCEVLVRSGWRSSGPD